MPGLMGCDAAFPVLHGPGGEDGSVQGLLAAPRRAVRGLGRRGVGDLPRQDRLQAPAPRRSRRSRRWTSARRASPRLGAARAGDGAAALGQARAPRLQRRDRQGRTPPPIWPDAVAAARRHDPEGDRRGHSGPGKEVECSLLGHAALIASVPGEIDAHADWSTLRPSTGGGIDLVVPAEICDAAAERVRELAKRVFRLYAAAASPAATSSSTATRLVNELNTIPGFAETSVYGKLLEAAASPTPSSATAGAARARALRRSAEILERRTAPTLAPDRAGREADVADGELSNRMSLISATWPPSPSGSLVTTPGRSGRPASRVSILAACAGVAGLADHLPLVERRRRLVLSRRRADLDVLAGLGERTSTAPTSTWSPAST